jgi:S-ribosylhomocysteine lyase LuxS involved in autoinducer biosynthesis|tara:strand:- start:2232 stop:2333 length:102 start_codon:yes stop_codon:yes gene_type:complete
VPRVNQKECGEEKMADIMEQAEAQKQAQLKRKK